MHTEIEHRTETEHRTATEHRTESPAPTRRKVPSRGVWLALGVLVGIAAAAAIVVGLGGRALVSFLSGADRTTVTESTVVRSIQRLQRFETVVYTVDQVVTEEREGLLRHPLAGEKILLIAQGEVIAGVDLSGLAANAVSVSGDSVRLRLPEARIFTTRVDNQKTRVYSRDTGLFSVPDPQLETRVRQRAESQLTGAAMRQGILEAASANAKQTLTALLMSLGFKQVTVE